jgi:DNA-binding beta-propeller fold protein YncE
MQASARYYAAMSFAVQSVIVFLLAACTQLMAAEGSYSVDTRIALTGEGGWDDLIVDGKAQRLYIARATRVAVVDLANAQGLAEIPDTPGVHAIALATELNRGYITCGQSNVVKVFALDSREIVANISVGDGPDAIVYEPITQRVFAFNGRGHNTTVIDAHSNLVVATIALAGKPEFSRADERGNVFVNIEDTAELVRIDARSATLTARWPLAHCQKPSGLAIDLIHRRGFSTCGNETMAITNLDTGAAVASLPIGRGVDGAAFDPDSKTVFASNGEGTLSIVRELTPDRYLTVQTLVTQRGARTMALDPVTHRLYLPTAQLTPAVPASAENPHPRPAPIPGTFVVLAVQRH